MHKFIETLRGKSETYRRAVAFGVSLAVTLVIVGVWVTTVFPNAVSEQAVLAKNSVEKTKIKQGPVATFQRNFAQSFSAIKTQWSSFSDYLKATNYEAQNELKELQVISLEQKKAEMNGTWDQIDGQTNGRNMPTNKGDSVIHY